MIPTDSELSLRLEGDPLPASTYALFQRGARRWGEATALTVVADAGLPEQVTRYSYTALLAQITRAANLFHALGIGAGDVVAYALPNLAETHFVLWGAQAAGIAFAVNPALGVEAIAQLLAAAGARVLVTMAARDDQPLLAALAPLLEQCPQLRCVVTIGRGEGRVTLPAGISSLHWNEAIDAQPGDRLLGGRVIEPDAPSSWFCTGGTTGLPKIARRCHGNEVANAAQMAVHFGHHVAPGTRYFCGLPLFHVNAITVTGLLPWLTGGDVVLGPASGYRDKAVIANFWRLVEAHRINVFSGVPTIYSALLDVPAAGRDLSSLDFGICGAAPMPVELFRRFEQATGVRIVEAYGLTESTCVATLNPVDGERRIGSIGQAIPGQQVRCLILDDDGRFIRDAAVDEVGVLAIAGPNVFQGYGSESQDRGLWIDRGDGRRWLNSGDLGRCDAQGYHWLAGRKKQLIIRGGHNIDPAIIEEALHGHPAVALAAAVGRPDGHAGELPVAYVQLKPGAVASEAELLAFAVAVIGEAAARPKALRVISAMPVTAVGKIFKPALVEFEIADVVRGEAAACGAQLAGITVQADPKRGPVARIEVAAGAEALRAALGRYSFAHVLIAD